MSAFDELQHRVFPTAAPMENRPGAIRPSLSDIPPLLVSSAVLTFDSGAETTRHGGTNGYTHASSLIDCCPRQHAISRLFDVKSLQHVKTPMRLVWALGRAAEKHVRDSFIGGSNPGLVWGYWTCACKRSQPVYGNKPSTSVVCTRCGTPYDQYKEVDLIDNELKITGHPDMLIQLGGKMIVLEIKSMDGDKFKQLTSPLGDHIEQALLYRMLVARLGFAVHSHVIILYVSKKFVFTPKDAMKEFHVDCTTDAMQNRLNNLLRLAASIRDATKESLPAKHPSCGNIDASRAKLCGVCDLCFQL